MQAVLEQNLITTPAATQQPDNTKNKIGFFGSVFGCWHPRLTWHRRIRQSSSASSRRRPLRSWRSSMRCSSRLTQARRRRSSIVALGRNSMAKRYGPSSIGNGKRAAHSRPSARRSAMAGAKEEGGTAVFEGGVQRGGGPVQRPPVARILQGPAYPTVHRGDGKRGLCQLDGRTVWGGRPLRCLGASMSAPTVLRSGLHIRGLQPTSGKSR